MYGTRIGIIRIGAWGTVIHHPAPAILRTLWLPTENSAGGLVVLTTKVLDVSITGYSTTLDIINFPDGLSYEPW